MRTHLSENNWKWEKELTLVKKKGGVRSSSPLGSFVRIGCCRDRRLLFPRRQPDHLLDLFCPHFFWAACVCNECNKMLVKQKSHVQGRYQKLRVRQSRARARRQTARNTVYRVEIFFHKRKKMLWRVKKKLKCKYFIKRPFKNWQCVVVHYGSLLDRVLCGWVTNLSGVYLQCGCRFTADLCTAGCGPPSSISICIMPATRVMTQETLVFSPLNL